MEEKKFFTDNNIKFLVLLACILLSILGIAVFNARTYQLPIFQGTLRYQEQNWQFGEKGGKLQDWDLRDQVLIEPGKTYELKTRLTYSGEGDDYPSAFFTVGNYEVTVFLDGQQMFRYTREERGYPMLQGMGGAVFSIPLGENCQGKELELELTTSMDYALERRMPGVYFGDHSAYMHKIFISNVPSFFISTAIFFVAIVLVLLGNSSPQKRWAYLFFSVFAMVIVTYRFTQDLFLMYIWANPVITVFLEFFTLVVAPLPVLLSYRFEMQPHFRNTFAVLIGISVVNILLQLMLHFLGIRDLVQNLNFTHCWILVCSLSLILMDLRVRKIDPSIHCMRKLIPIFVGALLDFAVFYVRFNAIGPGSFFVAGNFIGLGLLVSLSMMVWEARKNREKAYAEYERNRLLERIAYEDALTGIANRAAFTREIDLIHSGAHKNRSIFAIEADLNDLKKTNDMRGHGAGDDLIRRAAKLLYDCFQGYGCVYRTGGDEFYCILYDVTEDMWERMRDHFYQEMNRRNEGQQVPLSMAIGHAVMKDSIDKCIQLADKRMYQNKTAMKENAAYGFSEK